MVTENHNKLYWPSMRYTYKEFDCLACSLYTYSNNNNSRRIYKMNLSMVYWYILLYTIILVYNSGTL